ncbi:MAG: tetratricopeptide repeat protein [Myxococcales bacterium]|nr:tetratricopeptide repeat protein [Myxococcales bacterium]
MADIDGIWNFGDAAGSEAAFKAALAQAPAAEHEHRLELRTQVARAMGLQDRFDEGHAELDAVAAEVREEETRARMRLLLERGRLYNSAKRRDEARAQFLQAWDLGREAKLDRLAVDAAHMLGIVELKEPDLALQWSLKALDYAEQSEQQGAKKWLGSLYNNIGWTYFDKKDYDKALELFEKALRFRETQDDLKSTLIARWTVARGLRALGRSEEALQMLEQLQTAYAEAGLEPSGYLYEELGENLLALGKDGHREHFARAHAMLSTQAWLVESEPERIARLERLAAGEAPAEP